MADDSEKQSASSGDEKILSEARDRLKLASDAESEIRRLALEDMEFRAGKQWPDQIRAERDRDGRPCLVINRVPQFIQQITNDQRQNRPSIKVHPVDDQGDPETAEVIQGLVRHIEYNSNADVAYDTGFDSAVTGGFGYLRIITDYVNPESFDQEILIKRIRNPMSVYLDPYAQEPDGSDATWGFIVDDLSPEEYKARFKDSKLASMQDWETVGNQAPDWVQGSGCRVAEYFYLDYKNVELVLFNDGTTLPADKVPQELPEGVAEVRRRISRVPVVQWCKLNGIEILERTTWLGRWIPIVPIYGNELYINGKRILEGVVRNAKDSQRMYNYWASAETEAIALAPRAPFIMADGQDEGYEEEWKTANRRNHSTLKYKPTSVGGQPVGPPQRNAFEPAVQAITQARMMAAEDLKATTGIYDASLGAKSNETSGIAIQRRNTQAQTSNFHFVDNLTRSLRHTGRILVDLIPRIYDTARAARIIGDDGEQDVVQLNTPFQKNGQTVLYDLSVGEYDVTVDVGPSFASKRQEAVASMIEFIKAYPQAAQAIGDLLAKNMDWPGSQEIADRLRKMLPPGIADDPKNGQQQVPPEVQAKMQQMGQMVQQLTAALHQAHDERDQKTLELESKERIEFAKIDADMRKALMTIDSKESVELLKQEVLAINHRLQLLNIDQPIGDESQQDFAQPSGGAPGAGVSGGALPTGGQAPGSPMEGTPPHV